MWIENLLHVDQVVIDGQKSQSSVTIRKECREIKTIKNEKKSNT